MMKVRGVDVLKVGGDAGIPVELAKRLNRMGGTFHVKLPLVKRAKGPKDQVTGWASIITKSDGTPIIDFGGDIIPVGELEKAAHAAFLTSGGKGKAGDMHEVTGVADVVESFVVTREKRKSYVGLPMARAQRILRDSNCKLEKG